MFSEDEKFEMAVNFIVEQEEKGKMYQRGESFVFPADDGTHVSLIIHALVTDEMRAEADAILANRRARANSAVQKTATFIAADEKNGHSRYAVGDPVTVTFTDQDGTQNTLMTVVTPAIRAAADTLA